MLRKLLQGEGDERDRKNPFIPFIPVEITAYSTRPGNRNSVIGNGVIGV
jgi:hypothetical protein